MPVRFRRLSTLIFSRGERDEESKNCSPSWTKACLKTFCVTAGAILSLCVALVFCVDPFYHFHAPWFGLKFTETEGVAANPGVAKHYPYESAIAGSSMIRNFDTHDLDEEFGTRTVKFYYSSASAYVICTILELAFQTHPNMSHVFIGFDTWAFAEGPSEYWIPLPTYLYDESWLNDSRYLINVSALKYTIKMLKGNLFGGKDYSKAYMWSDLSTIQFGPAAVASSYDRHMKQVPEMPTEQTDRNAEVNLARLLKIIRDHPGTTFHVFVPPYSMACWERWKLRGELNQQLSVLDMASREFCDIPNVQFDIFLLNRAVTTNLENYMDFSHYSPEINRQMVTWMKRGDFRVTRSNVEEVLQRLRRNVTTYPFDDLFKEH